MKRPVPKIRTEPQSAQVNPVLDNPRTTGQPPLADPVPNLPPREWGQGGQGRLADLIEERRQAAAERKREREELAVARQHGLEARKRAKLRHLQGRKDPE